VDSRLIMALLVVVVLAGIFSLMVSAWKRRTAADSRYSVLAPGLSVSPLGNAPAQRFDVLYVATTRADDALHRITIPGLAFRASAMVVMADHALEIAPRGEVSTVIPASNLMAIFRGQVAIDRVVEKDGLTAIEWLAYDAQSSSPIPVVSYFRISSPDVRNRCESALRSTYPHAAATLKEVSS
jgi:hypothetical protein